MTSVITSWEIHFKRCGLGSSMPLALSVAATKQGAQPHPHPSNDEGGMQAFHGPDPCTGTNPIC